MENNIFELQYALDTFYFLVCGALVMWMAAGFAMLEAGLVRAKNTTEILVKNVGSFSLSCIMYLVCGYAIMYGGNILLGGIAEVDSAAVLGEFAGVKTVLPATLSMRLRRIFSFRWCLLQPLCRLCPVQLLSA